MSEQWYYQAFEQEFGPLSLDELAQMMVEGGLSESDLVREGKHGSWGAAANAKVLKARASEIAAESAEVATDIDSFMLTDEQHVAAPVVANRHSADGGAGFHMASPLTDSRGVWYFQTLGETFGPVPFSELLELAKHGEVGQEDEVRKGETGQWIPAGLVDGLFPEQMDDDDQDEDDDNDFAVAADVVPVVTTRSPSARPSPTQPASRTQSTSTSQTQSTVTYQATTAAAPVPVAAGWYCYLNDQEYGPIGITELQGYVATGQITAEVYVKEGFEGEWILASQVPGLCSSQPKEIAPTHPKAAVASAAAPAASQADTEKMELAHQLLALLKQEINPGGLSAMAAPTAGGWYCNISGSMIGPVAIDSLVQMVLQKRIFPDDMIRLGAQGEWFPAKTFPEFFPSQTTPGKKKSGIGDAENVLSRIDKMYRDAEAAKEKTEPPRNSTGTPAVATKTDAAAAARPAPKDLVGNINKSIARAAVTAPSKSSASSSGGDSMGEQLNDLLGKILGGKGLYVLIAIAVVGLGWYFAPILFSGMVASSTYDGIMAIHSQVVAAHDGSTDPAAWKAPAEEIKKKLAVFKNKVKGGTGQSPLRDLARMINSLSEMAEYAATKAQPGVEDDPYTMAAEGFKGHQKKAKTKLGKK